MYSGWDGKAIKYKHKLVGVRKCVEKMWCIFVTLKSPSKKHTHIHKECNAHDCAHTSQLSYTLYVHSKWAKWPQIHIHIQRKTISFIKILNEWMSARVLLLSSPAAATAPTVFVEVVVIVPCISSDTVIYKKISKICSHYTMYTLFIFLKSVELKEMRHW